MVGSFGLEKTFGLCEQWTRCEEKLPPLGQYVLCYCHGSSNEKKCHVAIRKIEGNVFVVKLNPEDHGLGHAIVPTHWMPLPEPAITQD